MRTPLVVLEIEGVRSLIGSGLITGSNTIHRLNDGVRRIGRNERVEFDGSRLSSVLGATDLHRRIEVLVGNMRTRETRNLLLVEKGDHLTVIRSLDIGVEEGELGSVKGEGARKEDGSDVLGEGTPDTIVTILPLLVVVLPTRPLLIHTASLHLPLGMLRHNILPCEEARNLHGVAGKLELSKNTRLVHHTQPITADPTRLLCREQMEWVGSRCPANVVVVRMVVVQLMKEERVLGITELSAPVCVIQVDQNSDELETLGQLSTASVNSTDDSPRALDGVSV